VTEPEVPGGGEPQRRRPIGLLILAGSVLASAVWWMLTPPRERPVPAAAPAATAPAPVPGTAPAARPTPAARPSGAAPRAAAPEETPAAEALPPPPPAPLLRVTADVEGADVFVDRTFVGKAPLETREIAPGRHQVQVSAAGYDGITKGVDVSADGPTEVAFALKVVVLDTAVDVVHRHRIGSCEGRLTADVSGLRYAPRDGGDGVQVPFARLDAFTIDYVERNLQVKVRGGRTWNFTTKAANADPLLVFHRDVEKARNKLAGGA
jgi:hypothetical protein